MSWASTLHVDDACQVSFQSHQKNWKKFAWHTNQCPTNTQLTEWLLYTPFKLCLGIIINVYIILSKECGIKGLKGQISLRGRREMHGPHKVSCTSLVWVDKTRPEIMSITFRSVWWYFFILWIMFSFKLNEYSWSKANQSCTLKQISNAPIFNLTLYG